MRSRRRWLAGIVLAVMIAAGLFLALQRRAPNPSHFTSASANGAAAGTVLPTHPAPPAAARSTTAANTKQAAPDENDCPPPARGDAGERAKVEADRRWQTIMINSDDLHARATVLYMRAIGLGPPADVPAQDRESLAQLAAQARDPAVYAIASTACHRTANDLQGPNCAALSTDQWAQVDPGNAVPWLLLAQEARDRHDATGEAAAFARAAAASKIDAYGTSLYAFAQSNLPQDLPLAQRVDLATNLIGVQAAWPMSWYAEARSYCSADALRNDTVRTQCNRLAELAVNRATSLIGLMMGTGLGKRLGWSSQRIGSLTDESKALMFTLMERTGSLSLSGEQEMSCDQMRRDDDFVSRVGRTNELEVVRDIAARSGESIPDLAQRYEQWEQQIREQAASENK